MSDTLGTWAEIMSIVSGAILAAAAIFAFVLQRSNYLKRTYPKLSVESIELIDIASSQLDRRDSGASLRLRLENNSDEPLSVSFQGDVFIRFPVFGDLPRSELRSNIVWRLEPQEIQWIDLAIPVPHLPDSFEPERDDQYWVNLRMIFGPDRDLFMILISPWTFGIRRHVRIFSINFGPAHGRLIKGSAAPRTLEWRSIFGKPILPDYLKGNRSSRWFGRPSRIVRIGFNRVVRRK